MANKAYDKPMESTPTYYEWIWDSLLWRRPITPPTLCDVCLSVFTAIRGASPGTWLGSEPRSFGYPKSSYIWGGSHHTKPGSFLSSVRSKCYICYTIFRDCNDAQRKLASGFQIFYRIYELKNEIDDSLGRYGLRFGIEIEKHGQNTMEEFFYDCQGDFKVLPFKGLWYLSPPMKWLLCPTWSNMISEDTKRLVNDQEIPLSTSDPRCLSLARTWLTDCVRSHTKCHHPRATQQFYPTRVLNLGSNPNDTSCRLQNCGAEPPNGPYCTLSHCWGNGKFFRLTKATSHKLESGIPVESLSKTFQDAILAVKSLGSQYLWIDALCIIQDSEEDWRYEAARMSDIYARSYCNIAATDALNGEGCLVDRAVSMVRPCLIDGSAFTKVAAVPYTVAYDDFWSMNLLNAPLHQRGWVLQERLLSPRTIHFGNEQILWECRGGTACESYPRGIPKQLVNPHAKTWRLFDSLPEKQTAPTPKADTPLFESFLPYSIWSQTVERYMECKLSNPRDKLVAIAGIAQKVAQVTEENYLAGLWDNRELAIQLLWHVLTRRQADNSPSQRPSVYRAPSWSWACLEATIVWDWPTAYDKILININEALVVPRNKDPMCEIQDGALRIRGCLFEAKVEIARVKTNGLYDEDGDYNLLVEYDEIDEDGTTTPLVYSIAGPVIHLDTALMPNATRTVYCLPVCTGLVGKSGNGTLRIAGLLLDQIAKSENQYTRIGIFGLDKIEACHFYGLDVNESDRIDEVFSSMLSETFTLL
jgi:hypothetical protein